MFRYWKSCNKSSRWPGALAGQNKEFNKMKFRENDTLFVNKKDLVTVLQALELIAHNPADLAALPLEVMEAADKLAGRAGAEMEWPDREGAAGQEAARAA
jgi:hypothetical protein